MTRNVIEISDQLTKALSDERDIINKGSDGDIKAEYLELIALREKSISSLKQDLNQILNNYLSE